MASHDWLVALTALDGTAISFLEAQGLKLEWAVNAGMTCGFQVDARDAKTADIDVARRRIRVYRDGVLRFQGRIWEPLSQKSDFITVTAKDAWAAVAGRRVRTLTTLTSTDAGQIVKRLIDDQNGYSPTRMRVGAIAVTASIDRSIEAGKSVGDAITELAQIPDSFRFIVVPVDDDDDYVSEIQIFDPLARTPNVAAQFEYGEETSGKMQDYEIVTTLPINYIVGRGQNRGDSTITTYVDSDSGSIDDYDLSEADVNFSSDSGLDQLASGVLRPQPGKALSLTPGPESPMLWDDFLVGDLAYSRVKNGPLDWRAQVDINFAAVEVSDDGTETLTGLTLQDSADPTLRRFGPPNAALDRYISQVDRRIATLEHRV